MINVIVKLLHVVVSVVVQKVNNIYRLEQEFPSLVQKQAQNTPNKTLKGKTPSTININPRLYN